MNIGEQELRKRVIEWSKGNDRANWFSVEELMEIAKDISKNSKEQDGNCIQAFDTQIFIRSITEGKISKQHQRIRLGIKYRY